MYFWYQHPEQSKAMDKEPEGMEFLGIMGIIGEALNILLFCAKLLRALTLTLILPLSFAILGRELVFEYLLYKIPWNEIFYQTESGSAAGERIMKELTWERAGLLICVAAYVVFVLAFSLLSTAAVVYTVASMYTGKEISYGRVMKIVPRVWKRLMGTFFWFSIIAFACCLAFVLVCFLLLLTTVAIKLKSVVVSSGLIFITAVFFCGYVYISMVWHLACVISVLEDNYGLGAMLNSRDLIKGKRITGLLLDTLYLIFSTIIGWCFAYAVLNRDRHLSSAERGVYWTVLVGLLCFVHLMGLLTQSVFYFVCKSYHHESVDKSSLSNHLKIYHADYEPLKSSQLIQLDGVHFPV